MSKNHKEARAGNRPPTVPETARHKLKVPKTVEAEDISVARKAAVYCLFHYPSLWTAGPPRWNGVEQRWTIPVFLRYPTGHEAELGQLAFDGKEFTPLTERAVTEKRAQTLAEDPAFQRAWYEQFGPNR
jgi:hypothetical protein